MSLRILITGGGGFIGSHLAFNLVSKYQLYLLVRPTSSLRRLHHIKNNLEIIPYNAQNSVENIIAKLRPNVVLHTACCYGRNEENIKDIKETNINFGLKIFNELIENKTDCTFLNFGTSLSPNENYYAKTKYMFVNKARGLLLAGSTDVQFVNLCVQHVYGPNDDPNKFTNWIIRSCLNNEREIKLTDGRQLQDFIYIKDVITACANIIHNRSELPKITEIQIGSGTAVSIRNFVELIQTICQSKTKLHFGTLPTRKNSRSTNIADISNLLKLGWMPKYDLVTGLKETIISESGLCDF